MGFKVLTWNINGLRSFGGAAKWRKMFADFQHDIICFQETKIPKASIEEWMIFLPDYTSYFSFPQGQLSSSGYSGVATYCRESSGARPLACESSFFHSKGEIFKFDSFEFDEDDENVAFSKRWPEISAQQSMLPAQCASANFWRLADNEGRCLLSKHEIVDSSTHDTMFMYIFNLYCPRNDLERLERQHYQLRFFHMLEKRAIQILEESSQNHVIILGDLNTTFGPNDVYDDTQWCYEGSHGRKWLQDLLNRKLADGSPMFVDSFRHFHPEENRSFTCWNTQLGCRITNFGSRLDYILIDQKLVSHLNDCHHLTDYPGSDHCPVMIEFKENLTLKCSNTQRFSDLCSKSWPEFGSGSSQTSIKNFFSKRSIEDRTVFKAKTKQAPALKPSQSSMQNFIKTFKRTSRGSSNEEISPPINSQNETHCVPAETKLSENIEKHVQKNAWQAIFKQPEVPKCSGHALPCVRRKSKKQGPNFGKEFFSCSKAAMEPKGHPETNCGFFRWISK